jgi:hypothetical protein
VTRDGVFAMHASMGVQMKIVPKQDLGSRRPRWREAAGDLSRRKPRRNHRRGSVRKRPNGQLDGGPMGGLSTTTRVYKMAITTKETRSKEKTVAGNGFDPEPDETENLARELLLPNPAGLAATGQLLVVPVVADSPAADDPGIEEIEALFARPVDLAVFLGEQNRLALMDGDLRRTDLNFDRHEALPFWPRPAAG